MNDNTLPGGLSAPATLQPLRVVVVDDHAPTREAVALLLARAHPRIEVTGTAGDAPSAIRAVRDGAPHVVVLDLDLGSVSGFDLMPALKAVAPVVVVILSASDDPVDVARAIRAGAAAFVSKFSPVDTLVDTVIEVGLQFFSPGQLSWVAGRSLPGK